MHKWPDNHLLLLFQKLFPDSSVGKESACSAGDPGLIPGSGRCSEEGIGYPIPVFLGFPCGSAVKESACNVGDLGSFPGLGRAPREGKGYPLQCSGLENSMIYFHRVAKSQTRLSDFHFTSRSSKTGWLPWIRAIINHSDTFLVICLKTWNILRVL